MNWYLKVLKQYADFNGRARRKEYWMFVLFNMIACVVAMILDSVLGTTWTIPTLAPGVPAISLPYGWIYMLYCLFVLLPGLAVCVRRLHDLGKSGWNICWGFIPLVGGILLLVWACTEGQQGENKYGPDPKAA